MSLSDVTSEQEMILDATYSVSINNGTDKKWFKFTPTTAGTYYFYADNLVRNSEDDCTDPYGILYKYNSKSNQLEYICHNDDNPNTDDLCFWISEYLEKDVTYYLCAKNLEDSSECDGAYDVIVTKGKDPSKITVLGDESISPFGQNGYYYNVISLKITYSDNTTNELAIPVWQNENTQKDLFGNEFAISLNNPEENNGWFSKISGTYEFSAYYKKGESKLYETVFQKKLLNVSDLESTELSNSQSYVKGENLYKFTPDSSEVYLFNFSDEIEECFVHIDNTRVASVYPVGDNYNSYAASLTAEETYYIRFIAEEAGTLTYSIAKKPTSIEVVNVNKYCPTLSGVKGCNGSVTIKVNYGEGIDPQEVVVNSLYNGGNDPYGNRYYLSYFDAQNINKVGSYTLMVGCNNTNAENNPVFSNTFQRETVSIANSGVPITKMNYGVKYNVGINPSLYVFEYTPDEDEKDVFKWEKISLYPSIYEKDQEENRLWMSCDEDNEEEYIELTKGKTYYFIFETEDYEDFGTATVRIEKLGYRPPEVKPTTPAPSSGNSTPTVVNSGIPAQKVSVAKTKLSLRKGKSITISTLLSPLNSTDKLTYKSSNAKVVQVNANGKVTAKKPGKAKVTITTSSGKSVTITITVKKKAVATTKLSVKKKMTVKVGTVQFLPYKINASSTDKITWKSSKKSVLTVDANGKITAKKKGKATITIKAGKKKATCKVTVK
ncbi:MAG: Ig-like domain-containing protein [Anaerobutyricum sp.]|nr:Ig-like domain-containing protein [Anaerobutyricum sp.]